VRQEQQSARDPIVSQLTGIVEAFKQNTQQLQTQLVHTLKTEAQTQIKAALARSVTVLFYLG
jgi:dsDNA-specific endonuclease/ATPase MutS2